MVFESKQILRPYLIARRLATRRVLPVPVAEAFPITAVLAVVVSFFLMTWWPSLAKGQQRELPIEHSESLDVALIVDCSGSMLQTDPEQLRLQGADLFLNFLRPGDRVALIGFAESARVVRTLTEFGEALGATIRSELRSLEPTGSYTDLLQAIEKGREVLGDRKEGAKSLMVLLSDGKLDPDPQVMSIAAAEDKLLRELVPELRTSGISVYTLAFSDQADKEILQQIALGSEGISWFTPNADKVHQSFADLFLSVKKPQMVPVTRRGISIDGNANEANFYINHGGQAEPFLVSPLGERLDVATKKPEVKWYHGTQFDVVTVERPDVGVWVIAGIAEQDGFATVLTNLKLVSDWPNAIREDEKPVLQARLYEGNKPVTLPEMTGVAQFGFQVIPTDRVSEPIMTEFLSDDGKDGDAVARDGIFSAVVPPVPPGEYRMRVVVKSPTFEREQDIPFRVRQPWLQLRVVEGTPDELVAAKGSHDDHHETTHGDHKHQPSRGNHENENHSELTAESSEPYIEVELSADAMTFKEHSVSLFGMGSKGRRKNLELRKVSGKELLYRARAHDLSAGVDYELQASVTLTPRRGRPVSATSKKLHYRWEVEHEHHEEEHVAEEEEVVAEVKQEAPVAEESQVWPALLAITLFNALLALWFILQGEKILAGKSTDFPALEMPAFWRALMAELQEIGQKTSVPLAGSKMATQTAGGDGNAPEDEEAASEEES